MLFLIVHAIYIRYFAREKEFAEQVLHTFAGYRPAEAAYPFRSWEAPATTSRTSSRDGYTIVPDVFERRRRRRWSPTSTPSRPTAASSRRQQLRGPTTVRIYNLLVHGELFERVPVHPNVLPIVEGVLDRGCLISSLSSIAIGPGETAQPIHADDQLIPLPKPHPPTVCNTMWALTDFTEANGATRIIPGSHLADHSPDYGHATTTRSRPRCRRAACSSGTAACGTAAAPTRPTSGASASP